MNMHRKLKINWWTWMAISIPAILCCLFIPRLVDKAGDYRSDWSYLIYYLSVGDWNQWQFLREILFWSIFVPLLLGWIAQYFVSMAWAAWQVSRRGHDFSNSHSNDKRPGVSMMTLGSRGTNATSLAA